jgi:hypothetical protein
MSGLQGELTGESCSRCGDKERMGEAHSCSEWSAFSDHGAYVSFGKHHTEDEADTLMAAVAHRELEERIRHIVREEIAKSQEAK